MKTFRKNLKDIQPSQLYINKEKLSKVRSYLEAVDINNIDPIPVKKIGRKTFFTDGHTRAFILSEMGFDEVKVYYDEDDLDWLQYLIFINWCKREGIEKIEDLKDRIVNDVDYQKLWLDRCKTMYRKFNENINNFIDIKEVYDHIEKSDICNLVLRSLPEWFGIENAIKEYVDGVKEKLFLAVYVGNVPIGFLSIKDNNQFTSEIYVLGIFKEFHRRGIGRRLIENVEQILLKQDKKFLTVKTLGYSNSDKNYKKTRKFYRKMGFYPLDEFTEMWDEENPCLYMVKTIN